MKDKENEKMPLTSELEGDVGSSGADAQHHDDPEVTAKVVSPRIGSGIPPPVVTTKELSGSVHVEMQAHTVYWGTCDESR